MSSGISNHTGVTHSHIGMMDYARCPISEMHLGKFSLSKEFQSSKVNFKTEVFSQSADPHLTMHWIEEVERAKSIDELLTSRSIVGRRDFTDCDMLDAMIVSSLKRLLSTQVHFRKRVSVEEQRARKDDRLSRGRHIAFMISDHFRRCLYSNVCCLHAWRGDLGVDPSGRLPRSTTPTTMATVPPAQGGIQILGTVVDGHPVFLTEAPLNAKTH